MVKLLLRYGGNPQQSNRKGETPLKVASSPTMVNLLLGKGTYTSSEESSTGQWARLHGSVGGAGPAGGAVQPGSLVLPQCPKQTASICGSAPRVSRPHRDLLDCGDPLPEFQCPNRQAYS